MKKNQTQILELKNTMTEVGKKCNREHQQKNQAEERICELEFRTFEVV